MGDYRKAGGIDSLITILSEGNKNGDGIDWDKYMARIKKYVESYEPYLSEEFSLFLRTEDNKLFFCIDNDKAESNIEVLPLKNSNRVRFVSEVYAIFEEYMNPDDINRVVNRLNANIQGCYFYANAFSIYYTEYVEVQNNKDDKYLIFKAINNVIRAKKVFDEFCIEMVRGEKFLRQLRTNQFSTLTSCDELKIIDGNLEIPKQGEYDAPYLTNYNNECVFCDINGYFVFTYKRHAEEYLEALQKYKDKCDNPERKAYIEKAILIYVTSYSEVCENDGIKSVHLSEWTTNILGEKPIIMSFFEGEAFFAPKDYGLIIGQFDKPSLAMWRFRHRFEYWGYGEDVDDGVGYIVDLPDVKKIKPRDELVAEYKKTSEVFKKTATEYGEDSIQALVLVKKMVKLLVDMDEYVNAYELCQKALDKFYGHIDEYGKDILELLSQMRKMGVECQQLIKDINAKLVCSWTGFRKYTGSSFEYVFYSDKTKEKVFDINVSQDSDARIEFKGLNLPDEDPKVFYSSLSDIYSTSDGMERVVKYGNSGELKDTEAFRIKSVSDGKKKIVLSTNEMEVDLSGDEVKFRMHGCLIASVENNLTNVWSDKKLLDVPEGANYKIKLFQEVSLMHMVGIFMYLVARV